MRAHSLFIIAAAGLALTACATTDTPERQELVDAGELRGETSDGDRVRCENVRETGTRMSQRVCLTQREWDEIEDGSQRWVEDRNAQGQVVLPGPSGPS
ncbi:hypothetical protein ACFELO_00625 [Oceanicaulis sp. LC35]|uniref:hypothetical protein n=1 Tax=Oceanicaulis sp. LC35 TaxID=3349635 RepID=UPI003F86166C